MNNKQVLNEDILALLFGLLDIGIALPIPRKSKKLYKAAAKDYKNLHKNFRSIFPDLNTSQQRQLHKKVMNDLDELGKEFKELLKQVNKDYDKKKVKESIRMISNTKSILSEGKLDEAKLTMKDASKVLKLLKPIKSVENANVKDNKLFVAYTKYADRAKIKKAVSKLYKYDDDGRQTNAPTVLGIAGYNWMSFINEGKLNEISVKAGLEDVIKGRTTSIEGFKISKDMAEAIMDWIKSSSFGRKYGKQILKGRIHALIKPANAWGIERFFKGRRASSSKLKQEWKNIVSKIKEGAINEQVKLSSQGMWKDYRKYKIQKPPRKFAEKAKVGAMIHFTGHKSGAKGETWEKWTPLSWKATYGEGVKGDALSNSELDEKLKNHNRVQIKEGAINEGVPFPQTTPNEFVFFDFKKWAYKNRGRLKKELLKHKDSPGKLWNKLSDIWMEWAKKTNNKEFSRITDRQKFGRALAIMLKKENVLIAKNSSPSHKITVKEQMWLNNMMIGGVKTVADKIHDKAKKVYDKGYEDGVNKQIDQSDEDFQDEWIRQNKKKKNESLDKMIEQLELKFDRNYAISNKPKSDRGGNLSADEIVKVFNFPDPEEIAKKKQAEKEWDEEWIRQNTLPESLDLMIEQEYENIQDMMKDAETAKIISQYQKFKDQEPKWYETAGRWLGNALMRTNPIGNIALTVSDIHKYHKDAVDDAFEKGKTAGEEEGKKIQVQQGEEDWEDAWKKQNKQQNESLDRMIAEEAIKIYKERKLDEQGLLKMANFIKKTVKPLIDKFTGNDEPKVQDIEKTEDRWYEPKPEPTDSVIDIMIKKEIKEQMTPSQTKFLSGKLKLKKGDKITYDQHFQFGKVSKNVTAKVVAVREYTVFLDKGPELDLRQDPIKKINGKTIK